MYNISIKEEKTKNTRKIKEISRKIRNMIMAGKDFLNRRELSLK